jgi:hypothetical protein
MFKMFRKRRGDGPVDQRAPLPPLSADLKAERDRQFAERLQQRLDAQLQGGFTDDGKIEPKFKTSPKQGGRAEPAPKPAAEPARPNAAPARADLKSANGTARPERPPPAAAAAPPPAATPERETKRAAPILSLPLIMRAAQFAAERHKAQRRKGTAREPYINHVLEVASLLAEATEGNDPELITAGLLHDLIDEQGVSADEMASLFGVGVAALVLEVTDDKTVPPVERRRLQIVAAPHKSPRARMLKIADIVSDLRALRHGPPADWSPERQREYLQWARDVVGGCRGVNGRLDGAFDDAFAPLAPEPAQDLHLRASSA